MAILISKFFMQFEDQIVFCLSVISPFYTRSKVVGPSQSATFATPRYTCDHMQNQAAIICCFMRFKTILELRKLSANLLTGKFGKRTPVQMAMFFNIGS